MTSRMTRILHILDANTLPPKIDPDVRPMKGLVIPMILIATPQVLVRNHKIATCIVSN